MEISSNFLRPMRRAIQPAAGSMMALATQIAGQNPGGFIGGSREAAGDVAAARRLATEESSTTMKVASMDRPGNGPRIRLGASRRVLRPP